jgi:deoxyribose-phosphate aldolase
MTMALGPEDMEEIATRVAERLAKRFGAARAGVEEPCEARPGDLAGDSPRSSASEPQCVEHCSDCSVIDSCPTYNLLALGADRIAPLGAPRTSSDVAQHIDHTLLKPDATIQEIDKLCEEARRYGFATVCLNSVNIAYAARRLAGSHTVPIAVVGFPLGASPPKAKAFEAREAVRCGAREIDMVINQTALKSKDYRLAFDDISSVVRAVSPVPVKVILETAALSMDEKIAGCVLAKAAGAAYVKTSTGFGAGGATVEDISLMRRIVGAGMGVKASGGIRTAEDAAKMFAAGADRVGASASVAIVTGQKAVEGKY